MNLAFLIGENRYGTASVFSLQLAEALRRQHVLVRCLDISDGKFGEACLDIFNDPPDLTCSFSDIKIGDKRSLGEQWQIPHLTLTVDPLIYFLHQMQGKYSLASCVDYGDLEWAKQAGFSQVFFLPHGADGSLKNENDAERPYDIALFSTCYDLDQIYQDWQKEFPLLMRQKLERAAWRVLSPLGISIFQALCEENIEEKDFIRLHYELDRFVCAKDRIALAQACAPFRLTIWGEGPWKKYVPWATCHPAIDFLSAINFMKQSKVVLHSCPRFKQGFHERIFYSLLSGASVVAAETPFFKEHFSQDEGILFYSYGHWEAMQSSLRNLLDQKELREARVARGAEIVRAQHSWDARATTFIQEVHRYSAKR